MKNSNYYFPEPKVTYSNVLFCPTNRSKPKDVQFTVIEDKEKLNIINQSANHQDSSSPGLSISILWQPYNDFYNVILLFHLQRSQVKPCVRWSEVCVSCTHSAFINTSSCVGKDVRAVFVRTPCWAPGPRVCHKCLNYNMFSFCLNF